MSKLIIAGTGFLIGGALALTPALALPDTNSSTPAAKPTTTRLTIAHVLRGCHVWSDGNRQSAALTLRLARGSALQIIDEDVDPHRLVQTAGPRLSFSGRLMRKHMMPTGDSELVLTGPGVYRFTTRPIEMPGGMVDVKTQGPDNRLTLRVTVA